MDNRPRDPRYLLVLSIASVVILVGGWLVRPRATPEAAVGLPSEADLAQLTRLAERRSLDNTAGYFAGVAGDVAASVVRVADLHASAVVWAPQQLVTTRLPDAVAPAVIAVQLDRQRGETRADRWGPNLPLTTLTVRDGPHWRPATPALALPAAGGWVVAVWRTDEAMAFAAGNYVERVPLACGLVSSHEIASSVPLTATMAGGGLFDLDGRLLGVILPCGERLAAIDARSIADVLADDATVGRLIHERYGLVVSVPLPEEAGYFNGPGVVVREIRLRQAGERAGFIAGDLIVAVNGSAVATVDDLAPILTSAAEVTLRRGPQRAVITVPAETGVAPDERRPVDAGLIWESTPRSFPIEDVAGESRAARAGVAAGDRIVRIDYTQPRSLDDLKRRLRARADRPVLVEIERDGRRIARWLLPEDARE